MCRGSCGVRVGCGVGVGVGWKEVWWCVGGVVVVYSR